MKLNPHISIDCVIYGFDGEQLKVLLVDRHYHDPKDSQIRKDLKLPGDFIREEEDLEDSAYRILEELTGLKDIFLRQFSVFGSNDRISREKDIQWLRETTGMPVKRVVTIAYYSLIKIDASRHELVKANNAGWYDVDKVKQLAFDHLDIMREGLNELRRNLQFEPVGMELLPEKFTIRLLQNLYELILDKELDNRNFRKKVLKARYLIPLEEKEKDVAHKPARLFRFDKALFTNNFNHFEGFQF